MSTTAPKPVTTPIPAQLSEPGFTAFILPHLSMPKRGPKCKLGYYRVFNLILWMLYTGMQWKCLPVPQDAQGKPAIHLSLSRLNHGQPGVQAHPKIVQGTADLHHEIADALLPQPDPVFHHTTTLHTTVDMLHPQSAVVERLVGPLLLQGQLRTAWLLRRHEDRHLRERERQEAQILQQPTPSREWVGGWSQRCADHGHGRRGCRSERG